MSNKQPVWLYVFFHDDVPPETQRIVPRHYLKDCIIELQKVTGREFVIEYKRSIPGLTDMNYKGDERHALKQWGEQVGPYVQGNNLSWKKTYRYMLVTRDRLNETVLGIGEVGGNCLIASLETYQTIAHELGHTFSATHEDSELQYNAFGGVCETYMSPSRDSTRGNCYTYTLKNRQRIADFLSDAP
jgi:hypothetical protein